MMFSQHRRRTIISQPTIWVKQIRPVNCRRANATHSRRKINGNRVRCITTLTGIRRTHRAPIRRGRWLITKEAWAKDAWLIGELSDNTFSLFESFTWGAGEESTADARAEGIRQTELRVVLNFSRPIISKSCLSYAPTSANKTKTNRINSTTTQKTAH